MKNKTTQRRRRASRKRDPRLAAMRKKHGIVPMQEVKNRAMAAAVQKTKGDVILAAWLLGIGRTSLYRNLKERGIKLLRRRA
ncbi:MAG TPA: helix-turn-helix domain-containing protein [Candidatus Angelobacter sp.]|jgi:transcriptional regulator of acetoin/glycerol metabolism|nr:helix-turn-helix domain-containing protein [Candidatus Angelobacter sp.]